MELKPLFFILAVTAALCVAVIQAHKVPQPYEETLAKIADKYEKPQEEMRNYIQAKMTKKDLGNERTLSIRSGRTNRYWQIFNGIEINAILIILIQ